MTAARDPEHVWVDGKLLPAAGPHLSVADRGFQLGDGIFETLRARGGHATELGEHLARLRHSAEGLDIPPGARHRRIGSLPAWTSSSALKGSPAPTATHRCGSPCPVASFPDAVFCRHVEGIEPTIVIQAWPVTPPPSDHLTRGLHVIASAIRRDPENPLVALKTTSRADYVHARIEARRAGAEDAVFLTIDGFLSEATTANVFVVRGDEIATPALACAILPGTTRSWVLGWAARTGLRATEGWLTTRDLAEADEAFLCSSVAGILPVTRFDGRPIGAGYPVP